MTLFGKKEETLDETLEKLRGHMKGMSDEERKKVMDKLSDDGKVTTGEQIEKAKEDIAEKGKDSQTEKDRIYESVAMQEKADGNEDSQSAKDRVDESEGEEKYLERKDGEKHDEAAEEDRFAKLEAKVDMLFDKLSGQFGWNDEDAEKAEKAKKVYGLGEGVVADKGEDAKKAVTAKEIGAVLGKFM